MVIAFANNQVIVAAAATTSTIYTDPVPLNDMDRATAHFNVEWIFNPDGTGAKYVAQVSLDGTNWSDLATLTDNQTAAGLYVKAGQSVYGAFLRFKLSFGAIAATGACCFDLHVLLDKA